MRSSRWTWTSGAARCFALLGPNGAGKTTLISIVCGIVNLSSGTVTADGHDIVRDYRAARSKIGLVPQELSTDASETVWSTVSFSRGLTASRHDIYQDKQWQLLGILSWGGLLGADFKTGGST